MAKTFRDAFNEHLVRTGWSVACVASAADVSVEQLKKLKQGKSLTTNVDDGLKVARAFGLSLDEFLDDHTTEDRERVVALWLELSEAERDLLLAAARGRAGQDHAAG